MFEEYVVMFGEYVDMWKNYANFYDRTTRQGYWWAVVMHWIIGVGLGFVCWHTKSLLLLLLFILVGAIPLTALLVRRLRDADHLGFMLIIVIGALIRNNWISLIINIIMVILACLPSAPDDGTPVV